MKCWEVLAENLNDYDFLEDFQKDCLTDYIACPDADECDYDGVDKERCVVCKMRWLESEWES